MKKILLSGLVALGMSANAQIFVTESFESSSYQTNGFAYTGGFQPGLYLAGCDGTVAIGSNIYTGATSNTSNLVYTKPASMTANGKKIDVSFTVSTAPYDASGSANGTVTVAYSTDGGTTYVPFGATYTLPGAGVTCYAYSAQIPESANITGNFKLRVQSKIAGAADDFYVFLDKVVIRQEATAIPACTSLTSPADATSGVSVRPTLSWTATAQAQSYTLNLGSTPGASDILSTVTTTNSYTPASSSVLPANTKIYATVTPGNGLGNAAGCTETTFTTGANPLAPYCGPMISTAPTQTAPIKSLTFNGTTNTSDATATTVGQFAPHESFVSTMLTVKNNLTSIPFSLDAIGITGNGWATSIYIDWNNDGDFDDVGEAYFNTTATMKRTTTVSAANIVTLTGDLAVPAGVALGQKRMRVKYNFCGTAIHNALATACSDINNGQVEDYTIDYVNYLAVNDINKSNVTVYPNPFKDVLKISDVKDATSVIVSDISGRTVAELKPAAELNLSHLNKGVYIVNIKYSNGEVKATKVIKE